MDGQNPIKKNTNHHGLRLIKGKRHEPSHSGQITDKPVGLATKKNPLVQQLSALADALDEDVKKLLNQ